MGSITPRQLPKQYLSVRGKPVLAHSLATLLALPDIARIVVVLNPADEQFARLDAAADPRVITALGGDERQDSVLSGLDALTDARDDDWVLVHDAVRPCVTLAEIRALLTALADHPAGGLLAAPLDNTLKEVDAEGRVLHTLDRSRHWQALTPQLFRAGILRQALESAQKEGRASTDEASAVEALGQEVLGQPVQIVPGSKYN
ncbi:MAG: 2-C-methyl-D-erythritol 4-phosphate cytidylyltransferase, partial [Pseudohongiellaceae bacterium]